MPDKSNFLGPFRVVKNLNYRINRIFGFPISSEICLFGIAFAVNGVAHDRTVMCILSTAQMGIFFFQIYTVALIGTVHFM